MDSEFEAESARVEVRAVMLQSIGITKKVKEENAASVGALVAKGPPFYATLQKVIASARGYNQWPAVVLTKVYTRHALKGLSNCKNKIKMVKAMQVQDMEKGRSSSYLDDLPPFMQGVSCLIHAFFVAVRFLVRSQPCQSKVVVHILCSMLFKA